MRKKSTFPSGWDEQRVQRLLKHYEKQSEEEAVAEDEGVHDEQTIMEVPSALVPAIRELIARHTKGSGKDEP